MTPGSYTHRTTCRLCNHSEMEMVVPLEPTLLAEKYVSAEHAHDPAELYPVDLYMCLGCGHVQILDVIDAEHLWSGYTYHSGQTQGILDHFVEISEKIVHRNSFPENPFGIDVGSNDGSLLKCFKNQGFRVLGIDPATEIARKASESGIETIPELISFNLAENISVKHGKANLITAFNVFAHADDMEGMLVSIREMLAPDGVFVFEVSYLMDIIDKMLLGTIFHEHMCHHSLIPLQLFLHRFDMEIIHVERVSIQGGSLVGTVQHIGGGHPISPTVQQLYDLEIKRGLNKPPAVRAFSERLKFLQQSVSDLITQWQQQNAVIAGFGAARSGPTLTAQFKLGSIISYIFDDHHQKVNLYTSGDGIPVIPSAELLKRQPDYVFILAWIHAKKIIQNNLEYLEKGGKFVLFCPEVKVIGLAEAKAL